MNIKYLFSILTTGLFILAGCSEENEVVNPTPPDQGGTDDPTRREVLLTLKNNLVLKAPGTKAGEQIATAVENYIYSLDVYVFGSKEENGTYTFQELHYFRDEADIVTLPNGKAYSFNLTGDVNAGTTSGLLKLNKGLFIKLYCVANRSKLYKTDGDAVTLFDNFKSLEQSKPGMPDNVVTAGIPTEDEFKTLHTKLIDVTTDPPTVDDMLESPLPMSGAYTTPLDLTDFGTSARTQIGLKLSRMVARFDVINDAEKSKFTVEKISMGRGQSAAQFFPIKTLVTDADKLITYPEREIDAENQQADDEAAGTTSLTQGAFYTYPSPKEDNGYLMLKGKYAVNKTESTDVSYKIPFQQMVNGVGTYIEVAYNHRYTIAITKADKYHLDFNLKVAEWDEPGDLDPYEPDNEFDKKTPVTLLAAESQDAYVMGDGRVSVLAANGSKFAFTMGSNTELEDELVYHSATAVKWLVKDEENSGPVTKAASQETKYVYKVDETVLGNGKQEDIIIRLTNPASGMNKEIKVIATPGPVISLTTVEGNYNKFDPSTLTATIYNVAAQTIKLHAVAETRIDPDSKAETTGSTATVKSGDTWLQADGPVTTAEGDYTLTLPAVKTPLPATTTVTFASTASKGETVVKVVLKDPALKDLSQDDFKMGTRSDNTVNMTGGTGGSIPLVSLADVEDNSFTLTVSSPEGVDIATDGSWFETKAGNGSTQANGWKQTIITGKVKTAIGNVQTGGKITVTNKLDATDKYVVEVVTTKLAEVVVP